MADLFQSSAAGIYAQSRNAIARPLANHGWEFEYLHPGVNDWVASGWPSNGGRGLRIKNGNVIEVYFNSANRINVALSSTISVDDDLHIDIDVTPDGAGKWDTVTTVTLIEDGGNTVLLDSHPEKLDSVEQTEVGKFVIGARGDNPSLNQYSVKFKRFKYKESGIPITDWNANSSGGAGYEIPDDVGNNPMDVIGAINENHWVFYNDGATETPITLASDTTTQTAINGYARLDAELTSQNFVVTNITIDTALGGGFVSETATSSDVSGFARLFEQQASSSIATTTISGRVVLSASFTSTTLSASDVEFTSGFAAAFASVNGTASDAQGFVRFQESLSASTSTASTANGFVRYTEALVITSSATDSLMEGIVILRGVIASTTQSISNFNASLNGATNARHRIVVRTDLTRVSVVNTIGRISIKTNLGDNSNTFDID